MGFIWIAVHFFSVNKTTLSHIYPMFQVVMKIVQLLPDGHKIKKEVDMALDAVSETMTPMHYHLREIIICAYRQVSNYYTYRCIKMWYTKLSHSVSCLIIKCNVQKTKICESLKVGLVVSAHDAEIYLHIWSVSTLFSVMSLVVIHSEQVFMHCFITQWGFAVLPVDLSKNIQKMIAKSKLFLITNLIYRIYLRSSTYPLLGTPTNTRCSHSHCATIGNHFLFWQPCRRCLHL